jgi:hypothetical protein
MADVGLSVREESSRMADARGVNGMGPRCGCGEPSKIHVQFNRQPDRDYFLCRACTLDAVEAYLALRHQADQLAPEDAVTFGEYRREHERGYHALVVERWCPLCEES